MAINPESQYPGKINPSDANYPYGSARNITTPGDGTGTPWEAALVNDIFGFQQALLAEAGIVPSGTPETATASQYLAAVIGVIGQRYSAVSAAEFGAGPSETAADNVTAITAAVSALPSTGGMVILPDGNIRINAAIADAGKTVTFLGPGTIIQPTSGNDGVRLTGSRSKLIVKEVDGSLTATTGHGVVCGFGGAGTIEQYVDCLIQNMPEHGLLWEQGPSLATRIVSANNGGDGIHFSDDYDDNNHGQIIAHCSNNGGWGMFVDGATVTAANRSRHHRFIMVKAFGNTLGGVWVNSRENSGSIFMEDNAGSDPTKQLQFGPNATGNELTVSGVEGVVDNYVETGSGNNVKGEDGNSEWTNSRLQARVSRIRDNAFVGGLELKPTANNLFEENVTDTGTDTRVNHEHGNGGVLTHQFQRLAVGGNSSNHMKKLERTGTGTLNFGTVAAGASNDQTISVVGAAVGDAAFACSGIATLPAGIVISAWVSAADTVTVRAANVTGAGVAVNQVFRAVVQSYG